MKKYLLLEALTLTFLFTACLKENKLNSIIDEVKGNNKIEYIIIATDFDCTSCMLTLEKKLKNHKNIYGFYITDYPEQLKIKLHKLFPKIKWRALKNKSILALLKQQKEEGPYLLKIQNHIVTLVQ